MSKLDDTAAGMIDHMNMLRAEIERLREVARITKIQWENSAARLEVAERLLRRTLLTYVDNDVAFQHEISAFLAGTAESETACQHEWSNQDFYLQCRKCDATMDITDEQAG